MMTWVVQKKGNPKSIDSILRMVEFSVVWGIPILGKLHMEVYVDMIYIYIYHIIYILHHITS